MITYHNGHSASNLPPSSTCQSCEFVILSFSRISHFKVPLSLIVLQQESLSFFFQVAEIAKLTWILSEFNDLLLFVNLFVEMLTSDLSLILSEVPLPDFLSIELSIAQRNLPVICSNDIFEIFKNAIFTIFLNDCENVCEFSSPDSPFFVFISAKVAIVM